VQLTNQMDPICQGPEGMARRDTPTHLTSVQQTVAKAVWALPDHRNIGPSDVQTEFAQKMKDSQHISCHITISICGNGGTWGKFH
jgi:hypothetical protein